mmetsp:Transcript_9744/g.32086  ORF Transcript_9744/g.32086 Transcript_9744/m.32086 type:complete len:141 (-) Transcript_9744:121-543(-)
MYESHDNLLSGVSPRSNPACIASSADKGLAVEYFECLADADLAFSCRPELFMRACVLFVERHDQGWAEWRRYGLGAGKVKALFDDHLCFERTRTVAALPLGRPPLQAWPPVDTAGAQEVLPVASAVPGYAAYVVAHARPL